MQEDDHYYVEGYSAELDPYAQENGVLKNNFGITDSASLNEVEADIAGVQIQKILKEPAPKSFTASQLYIFAPCMNKCFQRCTRGPVITAK